MMDDAFQQVAARQTLIAQLLEDPIDEEQANKNLLNAVDSMLNNGSEAPLHLEAFHAILKQQRAQDQIHSNDDPPILQLLAQSPGLLAWVDHSLALKDEFRLVPFLVCMIDVTKASSSAAERISKYLVSRVEIICKQWCHPHITVVRRSMELVKRLLPLILQDHNGACSVLSQIEIYAAYLQTYLTQEHLQQLQCPDRTEFFYQPLGLLEIAVDRECLKILAQILFASMVDCGTNSAAMGAIKRVATHVEKVTLNRHQVLDVLFDLCANNDEDIIQLQRDILNIYTHSLPEHLQILLTSMKMTPHTIFLKFLSWTGFHHEMLVDLLMSDETEFLEYFVKFLRYVDKDPKPFIATLFDNQAAEKVDGVLWRLVGVLTAGEFPYNPTVLVTRIHKVLNHIENAIEAP